MFDLFHGPEIPPHLLDRSEHTDEHDAEDIGPSVVGPQIPPELVKQQQQDDEDDEDDYAPALPPELLAARQSGPPKRVQGPALPTYDDDSDDDVGPKPLSTGQTSAYETDGVKQFMEQEEKRRKKIEEASRPKAPKRDEWMLVPPSSSDLLGTLDPTKLNKPRQFARSAAPAKETENNLWTETPAERQQRLADEVSGKRRRAVNADNKARKRQKMDESIRKGVEEHTRKVRGSALVDAHAKSAGKNDDEEDPSKAIWDHTRDMSIGGRLMDDSTRQKMLRDAKSLGDRFGAGKSGSFL
ncbi:uncharacterized protein EV420DRAFT_1618816 [Desarmillaria tabescens]|uniref:DUF3752 domain-containing protein n=1 Tax=Armillaria tabescens TaxID=1929756 RepID=A0AA39NE83_ARMTA|nr:uncharacterized protein EV420DRAFT_1618816 [Desarmillaria tabescens]KAK0464000.1 hypothetical protein EV420DRAFT_1618816 [Desarmillaria tabescens]